MDADRRKAIASNAVHAGGIVVCGAFPTASGVTFARTIGGVGAGTTIGPGTTAGPARTIAGGGDVTLSRRRNQPTELIRLCVQVPSAAADMH